MLWSAEIGSYSQCLWELTPLSFLSLKMNTLVFPSDISWMRLSAVTVLHQHWFCHVIMIEQSTCIVGGPVRLLLLEELLLHSGLFIVFCPLFIWQQLPMWSKNRHTTHSEYTLTHKYRTTEQLMHKQEQTQSPSVPGWYLLSPGWLSALAPSWKAQKCSVAS